MRTASAHELGHSGGMRFANRAMAIVEGASTYALRIARIAAAIVFVSGRRCKQVSVYQLPRYVSALDDISEISKII